MCGLIHLKKLNMKERASKSVLKRFNKQIDRGVLGFGFVELKNGYVVAEVRTQGKAEMLEKLEKSLADEIMFHHRIPTSTPNFVESTHPISIKNKNLKYNYFVMHNGIISNDDLLRDEHKKAGFSYVTEIDKKWITCGNTYGDVMWNDSESVAIDFVLALENGVEMKSEGSIAIVCLQYEKESGKAVALYFGRNYGNPLCIESTKDFLGISSESGKSIDTDILYKYDYETGKITEKDMDFGEYKYTSTSGAGYKYNYEDKYYEEEDYETDYEMEMDYLDEQKALALSSGDWDLVQYWETEIEELKINMKADKDTKEKKKYWLG